MIIHQDCRHFRSDVPCSFHKLEGVHCDDCPHYDGVKFRILIVKLDAMGDVLRTTAILPALKERYPGSHITWLTRKESLPLFSNSPYVDVAMDYSAESFLMLQTEEYDLVLGLDASPASARATTLARGKEKRGFGYHARGYSYPLNKETEQWYVMGLFDDVKKQNTKTYQDIILDICGLKTTQKEIQYRPTIDEVAWAAGLRKKWKLNARRPVVGFNPGAGSRWVNKKWPDRSARELIRLLLKAKCQVLLLGGQEEKELNSGIAKATKGVTDTGCHHSVREYAAIVNLCDVVVTMDTFSLHLASALTKRVVALFGPTSAVEIEMYGRGVKLMPAGSCACYYQRRCTAETHCMESITPAMVRDAVLAQLSLLPPS